MGGSHEPKFDMGARIFAVVLARKVPQGRLTSATESAPVSSFQTEQQARRHEGQQARQASRGDTD
jgi:hypothetical protein